MFSTQGFTNRIIKADTHTHTHTMYLKENPGYFQFDNVYLRKKRFEYPAASPNDVGAECISYSI